MSILAIRCGAWALVAGVMILPLGLSANTGDFPLLAAAQNEAAPIKASQPADAVVPVDKSGPTDKEGNTPSVKSLAEDLPNHPYEMIKEMTNRLLKQLEQFKLLETESEKEAFARKVVDETFAAMVDFELIARRVMAKHYNYATPEQRSRFAAQFRQSLINTYAMGMAAYSDQKVVLMPFEGIRDSGKRRRATVEMEVQSSDGGRYPLVYSLYETESGAWRLENLVINSVNIGLTFRNQFQEALTAQAGNIDAVIDHWNVKVSLD